MYMVRLSSKVSGVGVGVYANMCPLISYQTGASIPMRALATSDR